MNFRGIVFVAKFLGDFHGLIDHSETQTTFFCHILFSTLVLRRELSKLEGRRHRLVINQEKRVRSVDADNLVSILY